MVDQAWSKVCWLASGSVSARKKALLLQNSCKSHEACQSRCLHLEAEAQPLRDCCACTSNLRLNIPLSPTHVVEVIFFERDRRHLLLEKKGNSDLATMIHHCDAFDNCQALNK